MCRSSFAKHRRGYGGFPDLGYVRDRRSWEAPRHHARRDDFFGLQTSAMSSRSQVVAALAVLAPVVLSGIVLAFTPVWWIFTTYGWVVFPAFGLLLRGISGSSGGEPTPAPLAGGGAGVRSQERELLDALRLRGELSPVLAATETSLTVAQADAMLRELAEAGHLEVRARGGGIFYSQWGAESGRPVLTKERQV